jgi:tetratricopeptide (TPR) repeat protein
VLAREPDNLFAKAVYAAALGRTGPYDEAAELYEELLRKLPDEPSLWSTYGYILQTMGRTDEAVRAMGRATQLAPNNGEAWWTLANVKTRDFDAADVAAMRAALGHDGLGDHDRLHIHFSLGKAHEDAGDAAEAFGHYDRANMIRRRSAPYDPAAIAAEVDASIATFTRAFFEERTGWGAEANDPIFIVGLPRAGSTLIEQILASHPQVEGTKELLDIPMIVNELGHGRSAFFDALSQLGRDQARSLGEQYLERTRVQRVTGRPFFVDKLPTNWLHVPLIHLLLPNAKIVDARRHPLACGFSNFKQNYTRGQSFSYDLASIGHYYRQYVRMMAHVDQVLPGRVHRLFHEQLVADPEREVRRLLDYLGLPFDPACLQFHETDRAVRTPSAAQVRRPIDPQSVDRWRSFEPWLDPLKRSLGPVLEAYPDVPA